MGVGATFVLEIGTVCLDGELADTSAGRALASLLPIAFPMDRWGDEYYGDMGVAVGPVTGETVEVLDVGELAYWAPGNALCLFFGPTPVSREGEPRAASAVYPVGRVWGDWDAVKRLGPRVQARLQRPSAGS
jgi:hypothetical protein